MDKKSPHWFNQSNGKTLFGSLNRNQMVYGIIIAIIVVLFMVGVFDSKEDPESNDSKQGISDIDPWKYTKTTAQLYFDIYVSTPTNGRYYILKIGENNFAVLDLLGFPPDKSEKNQLLLDLDNKLYDFPERNLSENLGVCRINKKNIKIYFADKSSYLGGSSELPFECIFFDGELINKSLVFDIKEKYYDQSLKSSKIRTLREKVLFNQL